MFKSVRQRLLVSYLFVLGSILISFTLGVHHIFTKTLSQQLREKLTVIANNVAASSELERDQFYLEDDIPIHQLVENDQTLEWFTVKGLLKKHEGNLTITLSFSPREPYQIQDDPRLLSITQPIRDGDSQQLIGYIRASQTLEEMEQTIHRLDMALVGGTLLALLLSGMGGIWLTEQTMRPISESFERLKQFTADASHELRNPLMIVQGNAKLALRYADTIRLSDVEKFETILQAADQMAELTESLLFLARNDTSNSFGRSQQTITQEKFNLSLLLQELLTLYSPEINAKQIILSHQIIPDLELWGNANQINRLFANLLTNALKFTPEKGIIKLKTEKNNRVISVTMEDSGRGIKEEDISKIFDRFWQADPSRSAHQGSGLGLAIAQAIALNHGAEITVSSQLGKGSIFQVKFKGFSAILDS